MTGFLAGVFVLTTIVATVFFVPMDGKTLYERARVYYGLILIEQIKTSSDYKMAFAGDGLHMRTPKEQLRVPVSELKLPVISLWIEPKNKQILDTEYKRKWGKSIHYTGENEERFDAKYVDAMVEFAGSLYDAKVKLRGDGFWHFIGDPSYRIKLRDDQTILGMGPRFNLRRNEKVALYPSLLGMKVGERLGLPAPKANFAHLFVNGQYRGLRTMFEQYDEGFVAHRGINGWIFRETVHTPQEVLYAFAGEGKENYPVWKISKSESEGRGWKLFINFLRLVSEADDETFRAEIDRHIDISVLLRFANLNVLSVGEYLHTHDNAWMMDENGRMVPIVNDVKGFLPVPEVILRDPQEIYNPFLWRLFSNFPELLMRKERELADIVHRELPKEDMLSLVDGLLADVRHDVRFANDDFENDVLANKKGIEERYAFLEYYLAEKKPHLVQRDGTVFLAARADQEWIVDGILLQSTGYGIAVDGEQLSTQDRRDGTFFSLNHTFTPERIVFRPDAFDALVEETPATMAYMILHRQQIRFAEQVVPLTVSASGSSGPLRGEIWAHAADGTRIRNAFSLQM